MKAAPRDYSHSLARSSPADVHTDLGFREVLGHTSAHPHRFPVQIECRIKSGKMLMQAQDARSDSSKAWVIGLWNIFECLCRVRVLP